MWMGGLRMNQVKKGEKFNHRGYPKFDWICVECGLAWLSREQARNCSDRGHASQYLNHWGNVLKARRRIKLVEA